jgi:hypothetical protein
MYSNIGLNVKPYQADHCVRESKVGAESAGLEEDGIGRCRQEPCTHKIDNKTKQATVIIINLAVFLFTF